MFIYVFSLQRSHSLQLRNLQKQIYKNKCCEGEIDTIFNSPCFLTSNALIQFKYTKLFYKEYFNTSLSIYIFVSWYLHLLYAIPSFHKHYQLSLSFSSLAVFLYRHFAISAVSFGQNSLENGFSLFFYSSPFVVVIPSQRSSNGKSSWIGQSINFFPIRNWATRMMLPLPISGWFTMSIFKRPRIFTSPLITTAWPTLILNALSFCFRLRFSLRAFRCACFHLFHKAFLHRFHCIIRQIYIAPRDQNIWSQNWIVFFYIA